MEEEADVSQASKRGWWAVAAAWLALIGFAGLVAYMIGQASSANEILWGRLSSIYASVEAIAFAAAGALFGTAVQRRQTEDAEQRAEEAEGEAERGRTLAALLKEQAPSTPHGRHHLAEVLEEASLESVQDPVELLAKHHAELARRYFPD